MCDISFPLMSMLKPCWCGRRLCSLGLGGWSTKTPVPEESGLGVDYLVMDAFYQPGTFGLCGWHGIDLWTRHSCGLASLSN